MRKKTAKSKAKKKTSKLDNKVLLKKYYDSIHVAVIVLDGNFETLYMNDAAWELTGYDLKALNHKGIMNAFSDSSSAEVLSATEIVFRAKDSSSQAVSGVQMVKKNGRKIPVDFSVKHLKLGSKDCVVITLHDLSKLMKAQKDKETYLEELNHMTKLADIGRLSAGVAHELNNPLMIIQGFSENIQMLFEQNEVFEKDEILQQITPIIKATDRMAKIIKTMMKLARDDEIYMVYVDLWGVVEDALLFLDTRLKEKGIELIKDMKSPLGVVKCDPNQVEQI
ncbi:MAG: PAS domain S-box protein, partial [Bdellovibrionales bacterium]|nr:PAS domain S-box protein [Bdellovibrionales bacterium]